MGLMADFCSCSHFYPLEWYRFEERVVYSSDVKVLFCAFKCPTLVTLLQYIPKTDFKRCAHYSVELT